MCQGPSSQAIRILELMLKKGFYSPPQKMQTLQTNKFITRSIKEVNRLEMNLIQQEDITLTQQIQPRQ